MPRKKHPRSLRDVPLLKLPAASEQPRPPGFVDLPAAWKPPPPPKRPRGRPRKNPLPVVTLGATAASNKEMADEGTNDAASGHTSPLVVSNVENQSVASDVVYGVTDEKVAPRMVDESRHAAPIPLVVVSPVSDRQLAFGDVSEQEREEMTDEEVKIPVMDPALSTEMAGVSSLGDSVFDDGVPEGYVGLGEKDEATLAPPPAAVGLPGSVHVIANPEEVILEQHSVTGPPAEPDVRREPTAVNVVASKFVDLVEAGVERATAAEQSSGLPYKALKSRKDVVAAVSRLLDTFHLEPEVRKRAREAVLNRIMLENAESDEVLNQKLALDAAKQVGADLGIHEQLTQVGVQVNLQDLKPWISEPASSEEKEQ